MFVGHIVLVGVGVDVDVDVGAFVSVCDLVCVLVAVLEGVLVVPCVEVGFFVDVAVAWLVEDVSLSNRNIAVLVLF